MGDDKVAANISLQPAALDDGALRQFSEAIEKELAEEMEEKSQFLKVHEKDNLDQLHGKVKEAVTATLVTMKKAIKDSHIEEEDTHVEQLLRLHDVLLGLQHWGNDITPSSGTNPLLTIEEDHEDNLAFEPLIQSLRASFMDMLTQYQAAIGNLETLVDGLRSFISGLRAHFDIYHNAGDFGAVSQEVKRILETTGKGISNQEPRTTQQTRPKERSEQDIPSEGLISILTGLVEYIRSSLGGVSPLALTQDLKKFVQNLRIVEGEDPTLVDYITDDAPALFLVLAMYRFEIYDLFKAMTIFAEHGIKDAHLPLGRTNKAKRLDQLDIFWNSTRCNQYYDLQRSIWDKHYNEERIERYSKCLETSYQERWMRPTTEPAAGTFQWFENHHILREWQRYPVIHSTDGHDPELWALLGYVLKEWLRHFRVAYPEDTGLYPAESFKELYFSLFSADYGSPTAKLAVVAATISDEHEFGSSGYELLEVEFDYGYSGANPTRRVRHCLTETVTITSVAALLGHGALLEFCLDQHQAANMKGEISQALFFAIVRGHFRRVDSILERYPALASKARDMVRRTPVHEAVGVRDYQYLQALRDRKFDLAATDDFKATPLDLFLEECRRGDTKGVLRNLRFLASAGVPSRPPDESDGYFF
ncbi:hypothetical protein QBC35DRAFT_463626 [Podospora australis]|uniref:Uncharacterized protein n=1 Tax=Podospora australis TaxID=1536484 RepID=A0AAN7AHP8_9PEZI|nr:hypothetical protein QBC35DRAFT_463626 [Podospora australis]